MNRSILITLVVLVALLFLTHNVVQSAPSVNRESESNELFDTRSVWDDVKKWVEGILKKVGLSKREQLAVMKKMFDNVERRSHAQASESSEEADSLS
ncbi:unnamed protein product [Adineta ricciae]|uniref:Uncharacterized protein n=1 Tax=Adineta ricciae TaxID=249248 RepID=A0A814DLU7_ADIRI|nr:unnamed protein product [Adineta ricciae]CAF1089425.1 unnamed protein product [Adineta ricciae]